MGDPYDFWGITCTWKISQLFLWRWGHKYSPVCLGMSCILCGIVGGVGLRLKELCCCSESVSITPYVFKALVINDAKETCNMYNLYIFIIKYE